MKKTGKFVHLHVHSDFSMLDGMGTVEGYVERAKKLGMPALALTDHGNVCGAPSFYRECREAGIEPVLGEEFYFVDDVETAKEEKDSDRSHVVLLAVGAKGFQVLSELSSESHRNFYYKPLLERSLLENLGDDAQHLVALSGCANSPLSRKCLNGKFEEAMTEAKWWMDIFHFGNFYMELQNHDTAFDHRLNKRLIRIARERNVPIVLTNDPHYVTEDQCEYHDALLAVQTGSDLDDPNRFRFDGTGYHLRSAVEMRRAFARYPEEVRKEGVKNTLRVARNCMVRIPEFETRSWHIPKFPGVDDSYRTLKKMALKGLRSRGLENDERYVSRVKKELREFKRTGMSDFLLITQDVIEHAKKKGIRVGPGRGSVCGTLVGYLIGIHKIDSVRYDLLFERFLNPERPKMPDIDSDFEPSRREEMFEYVREKFGAENIVHVAAFQTMKTRAAFHFLASAHGISFQDRMRLSNLIVEDEDGAVVLPQEVHDNYPDLIDQLDKLTGVKSAFSSHPAGVLILSDSDPIKNYIPLMWLPNPKKLVGQYDLSAVEWLLLLKQDFLGLRNLATIAEAVRLIKKAHGVDIEPDDWTPDEEPGDSKVYRMLAQGRCHGVFQMEGGTNFRGIQAIKPTRFEDIVSCTSLYRAGPMIAGAPDRFLANRKAKKVEVIHESLEPILSATWGEMIYQEQMFEILHTCAGFSWAEVDDAKTAMTKKNAEKMAALKDKAIEGFQNVSGMTEFVANELWNMIQSQASYLFNRSHAVAYSYLTYQTARLKYLYPREYITALLRTVEGKSANDKQKRQNYLSEATMLGIKILPPHVNKSDAYAIPEGEDSIRLGFVDVKGIGEKQGPKIVANRPKKGYRSIEEARSLIGNKAVLDALTEAGAFECFGIETTQQALEDRMEWQFHDQMEEFRKVYEKRMKRPRSDNGTVKLYGEIVKIERRKTRKDKRDFVVWTIRYAPGEEYTITLWEDACDLWDLKRGSIVRVVGRWSDQWKNVGVSSSDEQVRVIKEIRGSTADAVVNSR